MSAGLRFSPRPRRFKTRLREAHGPAWRRPGIFGSGSLSARGGASSSSTCASVEGGGTTAGGCGSARCCFGLGGCGGRTGRSMGRVEIGKRTYKTVRND